MKNKLTPSEEREHLLQCFARKIVSMRPRARAFEFLEKLKKRHGQAYYEDMRQRCRDVDDERTIKTVST